MDPVSEPPQKPQANTPNPEANAPAKPAAPVTPFSVLSPELQQKIYDEMLAVHKQKDARVAELEEKVKRQAKALNFITNEGIEKKLVSKVSEVAPLLQFEHPEELEVLKEKNPLEYKKRVYRQYITLQNEKARAYRDEQLDPNGNAVYDKLKRVYDFFLEHQQLGEAYSPDDIGEYPIIVKEFLDGFTMMVKWTKLDADVSTIDEATINLMMQMWMQEITDATEGGINTMSEDYESKLEALGQEEKQELDRLATLEAGMLKTNEELAKIGAGLQELGAKLGVLMPQTQGAALPEDDVSDEEPEEVEAGDDADLDIRKSKKRLGNK